MNAILTALLSVTVYSAVILGVILLLRLVLRKRLSPKLQYLLWALFVLRLLVPVTLESGLHLPALLPQAAITAPAANVPVVAGGTVLQADTATLTPPDVPAADTATAVPDSAVPSVSARPPFPWRAAVLAVYLLGAAVAALVFLVSRIRFTKRLRATNVRPDAAQRELFSACRREAGCNGEARLCITSLAVSPMLLPYRGRGLVVVPAALTTDPPGLRYAMLHELTHFRRLDHLMCLLLAALRCIYWFNPLVWLGFAEMTADMETACDADVLCTLQPSEKRAYLTTLLTLFTNKAQPLPAMAQAQTRRLAEKRMKGAFMKPKSGLWTVFLTVLLTAVLLLTCFTTACQAAPAQSAADAELAAETTPLLPAAAPDSPAVTAVPRSYAFVPAKIAAASDTEVQITSGTGKTLTFSITDRGWNEDAAARGKVISPAEAAANGAQTLVTVFGDAVGDLPMYVAFWNSSALTGQRYNISVGGEDYSEEQRYRISVDAETGMVLGVERELHGEQRPEVFDNFDWETQDLTQIGSDVMALAQSFIESCYPTGKILFDSENLTDGSFVDGIQVVGVGDYLLACDAKIRMDGGPCYLVQVYYPQMEINWFEQYPLGWDACCMMEQFPEQLEWQTDDTARSTLTPDGLAAFAKAAQNSVGNPWSLDPEKDGNGEYYASSFRFVVELMDAFTESFSVSPVPLENLDSPLLMPGSILILETDDAAGHRAGVYVGDGKYVMADALEGEVVLCDLTADFGTRFPRVQVNDPGYAPVPTFAPTAN